MPISNWSQIPAIMNEVYRLQPKTVLDLGIGFGKYGALLREVLDGMHGRCRKNQWEAQICGMEAHAGYANPAWGCYTSVTLWDFTKDYDLITGLDLVLMIDSLEHMEPDAGTLFLDKLVANNKHVIVSVPIEYMPQGAVYGNELEAHRTHHKGDEFDRFSPTVIFAGATRVFSIKGAA